MRLWFFWFFFFSSRRRHTRLTCDWSSDVCSSDLCLFVGVDHKQDVRQAAHLLDAAQGAFELVAVARQRSEEHTSELQSHVNLVCRLLLEKKKKKKNNTNIK